LDKQENIKIQTDDIYRSIGHFAVEFEHFCESLRQAISTCLPTNGLLHQKLIRVLLADQTAYPLLIKYRAFIAINFENKPEEINFLKPLFATALNLIEERNKIIHGTWYVGWGSEDQINFDLVSGVKDKITKNGIVHDVTSTTSKEFDILTIESKLIGEGINRVKSCMMLGKIPSKDERLNEIINSL
jgi:hypothetical protein